MAELPRTIHDLEQKLYRTAPPMEAPAV